MLLLTYEVSVVWINLEPAQCCDSVGAAVGPEALKLLIEDKLEICCGDWLREVLEMDVVVNHDAALAESLNLNAVEGLSEQGVSVNGTQLKKRHMKGENYFEPLIFCQSAYIT